MRHHAFGPSQLLHSVTALLQGPLKGSVWDPGSARQTLHVLGVFLLTSRGLETFLCPREMGLASVQRMRSDGTAALWTEGAAVGGEKQTPRCQRRCLHLSELEIPGLFLCVHSSVSPPDGGASASWEHWPQCWQLALLGAQNVFWKQPSS